MTSSLLREQLAVYAAGLEAEIALLGRLHRLALDQRAATEAQAPDRLSEATEARARLMAELDAIERDILPARLAIAGQRVEASACEGFHAIAAGHRTADALVAQIVAADHDTVVALGRAEIARRETSIEIDAGEHTLAAYRRVIAAPADTGPSLVDRRG